MLATWVGEQFGLHVAGQADDERNAVPLYDL